MNKPVKILIVEDSEDDAKLTLRALRGGGFDPTHRRVQTAAELETALAEERWDAVISDFKMPGFTGMDALRIFRSTSLDIPFILISGTIGEETAVDAMKAGANDYLMKKSLARLAPALERELNETRMRAANRQGQRDLIESEARFRSLVEQAIAGIYIFQDGKITYANPRGAEILAQGSTDEVIGTDLLRWVAEADRSKVKEYLLRLLDDEARSVATEFGILHRDGVMIQVAANGARATYEGRPAIIGMMQDISEKRRAEETIRHYVAQIENAFMSTVQVVTTLGELRDPYTAGHQRRVAKIAVAIGVELGFDAHRQEGLRVAGYLHDIGKIRIPSEILCKPGKLSPAEFQLVQGHAQASYDVLKDVEFPWPMAEVALQHHERMDGSGYPQGLKGDAILLEARIMAVADVVEAMASHRPYRAGLGIEAAMLEIERGRGSAYDAEIADICLKLFREKSYAVSA